MNSSAPSSERFSRGQKRCARGPVVAVPLVIVFAVAAAVLTIYGSTFASMAGVWFRSETFAHGVLILPIAAVLLIRQRRVLAESTPTVTWWAVVALVLCVVPGWSERRCRPTCSATWR